MVKIVFVDFDGTLYSHFTNKIPESAIVALNTLHDKGIKTYICTGRSRYELDDFGINKIKLDGVISNSGQLIFDKDNRILYDCPISGELKDKIINKFNEKKYPIYLNTKTKLISSFINDNLRKIMNSINSPVIEPSAYNGEDFYMCSFFYENPNYWDDLQDIKDLANIAYWHNGDVDIVSKDASKSIAIKRVLNILDIKQEETMCFGDSNNDLDMHKFCELSIAMGNASDEIKEVSVYTTTHIDDDGIYNACKKFNLI